MKVISRRIEITGIDTIDKAISKINDLNKVIEELDKILKKSTFGTEQFDKVAKAIARLKTTNESTAKSFEENAKRTRKSSESFNTLEKEASKLKKQISELQKQKLDFGIDEKDEAQLNQLSDRLVKVRVQQQKTREEQKRLENQYKASGKAGVDSYRALAASLNSNRQVLKGLLTRKAQGIKLTRDERKEIKKLTRTIKAQDSALKDVDAQTGQYYRNVGNYGKSISVLGKNLLGGFGIVGGLQLLTTGMTSAAKIVVDFDQKVANLGSTSQASEEEMQLLKQQALDLGASTAFSASQVLELQTELAKLGFSTDQILAASKGVEDFAIAVGAKVPDAAALAGAALKGFEKDASEIEDVVSTLAVSTSESALDFQKLSVALPIVESTANAAGVSFERVVAQLGILVDRGVNASTAGTALKNIFIELAQEGLSYEDAMQKINNSTDKLSTATELFGKEGSTAAIILANNGEAVDNLDASITNVNDSLQTMVDQRLDTLQGRLTLLGSAWEGFILSVEDGDGAISQVFSGAVDFASEILGTLTELNNGDNLQGLYNELQSGLSQFEDTRTEITSLTEEYEKLKSKANPTTEEQERLRDVLDQLAKTVPQAVTGFDAFGNALDFNADKARQFINTLGDLNAESRKSLRETSQRQIESIDEQIQEKLDALSSGQRKVSYTESYFDPILRDSGLRDEDQRVFINEQGEKVANLDTEEYNRIRQELIDLQKQKKEALEILNATEARINRGSIAGYKERIKSQQDILDLNVKEIESVKELNELRSQLRDTEAKLKIDVETNPNLQSNLDKVSNKIKEVQNRVKDLTLESSGSILDNDNKPKMQTDVERLNEVISKAKKNLENDLSTNQIEVELKKITDAEDALKRIKDNIDAVRKKLEQPSEQGILDRITELEKITFDDVGEFNPVSEEASKQIAELKQDLIEIKQQEIEGIRLKINTDELQGADLSNALGDIAEKESEIRDLNGQIEILSQKINDLSQQEIDLEVGVSTNDSSALLKNLEAAILNGDSNLAQSLTKQLDAAIKEAVKNGDDLAANELVNGALSLPVSVDMDTAETIENLQGELQRSTDLNIIDFGGDDYQVYLNSKLAADESYFDQTEAIKEAADRADAKRDEEAKQRAAEKYQKDLEKAEQWLNGVSDVLDIYSQFQEAKTQRATNAVNDSYDKQIEAIESRYAVGEELSEADAEKVEQLEADRAEAIQRIEKEAFERQKRFSILQATINGALAVTKILATHAANPILAGVLTSIAAAQTFAQIAIISQQQYQAEQGAYIDSDGVFHGKSHKDGGIKTVINGAPVEVEGQEQLVQDGTGAAMVLKKKLAPHKRLIKQIEQSGLPSRFKRAVFSQLNVSAGGVSFPEIPEKKFPKRPKFKIGQGLSIAEDGIFIDTTSGANNFLQHDLVAKILREDMNYLATKISDGIGDQIKKGVKEGMVEVENTRRKQQDLDSSR